MADPVLQELTERFDATKNFWQEIRAEAATDMAFVNGDPWNQADKDQRADRPTIAPEEMGQYFNQVINALQANPRGMKFAPTGGGASAKGAQFYQNKAREIEYRSKATDAYAIAASNAIQRSYGYVRVETRYASQRSANQELWIEAFPDPDMVYLDPDAKRMDASDMRFAFVLEWIEQSAFKKKYRDAKVVNFEGLTSTHSSWVQGQRVLQAEYWSVTTTPRKLLLVQPPAMPSPPRQIAPSPMPAARPLQMFADELAQMPPGATVIRELRTVDYPKVTMRLTNGVEILHEQDWPGKFIPIVSCYGKVIYVPDGGESKRKILSMTRFGRDPWKAYCYACSQELEVLAMIPKAPVAAVAGQLDRFRKDWAEAPHVPKAYLEYDALTPATGQQILPPPARIEYSAGEHLQALEVVKEGFRRAIQAAMGSNFLPTQAQRRNEKSGKALDKMEQAATQGTYHFVHSYEGMVQQVGNIVEDLVDKIHDYAGETGVMEADGTAKQIVINTPGHQDSISTTGDYLVTISTAPSSDSEQEAAEDFTDTLVGNLQMVVEVSGQKVAAAVLAQSIRMRNLGPMGDMLADLIEPPEFKAKDGQPPNPALMAAQGQIQHLTGLLQQAAQEKHAKVIEQQGKFSIAKMQEDAETQRAAADREVKLAVAELGARVDRMALLLEESRLVGARQHDAGQSARDRAHASIEAAKDRAHDHLLAQAAHAQALEAADQGQAHALEAGQQAADLAPAPSSTGAGA